MQLQLLHEATAIASKTGKIILLANKESIVAAGELILLSAESSGTTIIPIDSEHNAIFQWDHRLLVHSLYR